MADLGDRRDALRAQDHPARRGQLPQFEWFRVDVRLVCLAQQKAPGVPSSHIMTVRRVVESKQANNRTNRQSPMYEAQMWANVPSRSVFWQFQFPIFSVAPSKYFCSRVRAPPSKVNPKQGYVNPEQKGVCVCVCVSLCLSVSLSLCLSGCLCVAVWVGGWVGGRAGGRAGGCGCFACGFEGTPSQAGPPGNQHGKPHFAWPPPPPPPTFSHIKALSDSFSTGPVACPSGQHRHVERALRRHGPHGGAALPLPELRPHEELRISEKERGEP